MNGSGDGRTGKRGPPAVGCRVMSLRWSKLRRLRRDCLSLRSWDCRRCVAKGRRSSVDHRSLPVQPRSNPTRPCFSLAAIFRDFDFQPFFSARLGKSKSRGAVGVSSISLGPGVAVWADRDDPGTLQGGTWGSGGPWGQTELEFSCCGKCGGPWGPGDLGVRPGGPWGRGTLG